MTTGQIYIPLVKCDHPHGLCPDIDRAWHPTLSFKFTTGVLMEERICAGCGKAVRRKQFHPLAQVFCSRECCHQHRRKARNSPEGRARSERVRQLALARMRDPARRDMGSPGDGPKSDRG